LRCKTKNRREASVYCMRMYKNRRDKKEKIYRNNQRQK